MGDFNAVRVQVARRPHKCNLCHGVIQKGETYYKNAVRYEGEFYMSKECETCRTLLDEFFKSDYADEGYCDEWMREWWIDVKCASCKHCYPQCNMKNCLLTYKGKDCCERSPFGLCFLGDPCRDMTHYNRCEKWEDVDGGEEE